MKRCFVILVCLVCCVAVAVAATAGPHAGGTFANGATGIAWTNPSNAGAEDAVVTTVQPFDDTPSKNLQVSNFGFSVPAGATIDGVTVEIKRSRTDNGGTQLKDLAVSLIKGGTLAGANKASATLWPTSLTFTTYGGAADLWTLALTSTDVNASNFGVSLRVSDTTGLDVANVDFIRITINYTAATGPSVTTRRPVRMGD